MKKASGETLSIYVATHKKEIFDLPEGYLLCQVNAERNGKWPDFVAHDNDCSDNISFKNDRYCELTALYALWKDYNADIKGLAHYRRIFSDTSDLSFNALVQNTITKKPLWKHVLKKDTIIQELKTFDIIVQFPQGPYFVNAYEDLLRFVYPLDIRALSNVIHRFFPDYEKSYKAVLQSTHISYLNMFIARNETFTKYCEWLFDVLCKLENEINIEDYDTQHKRIYGYLGEVLLNVWIHKQKLKIKYVHCIQISTERTIRSLIRNSELTFPLYISYIKLRWKKNAFIKKKIERLKEIREDPYAYTLDNDYKKIKCLEDAERFLSHFSYGTICKESVVINGRDYAYICLKTEGKTYQYIPSNNRCIITVFIHNEDDMSAFVHNMHIKYGEKYTVNIRIITQNPQVLTYKDSMPEIYVYGVKE